MFEQDQYIDPQPQQNIQAPQPQPQNHIQKQPQKPNNIDPDALSTTSSTSQLFRSPATLNENSDNQILTIVLQPGQSFSHNGKIIASNLQIKKQKQQINFTAVWNVLKKKAFQLTKQKNETNQIAYYMLKRKYGGGKILHINQKVYLQNFYINYSKILTINKESSQYKVQKYKKEFEYLSLINLKQKQNQKPLEITLQSAPGSVIIEKSIGMSQKIYLGNAKIIAMSRNLLASKVDGQTVVEGIYGQGFVFFEPFEDMTAQQNLYGNLMQRAIVLFILFFILFVEIV